MSDRSKLMWMLPVAGFLAFAGFGSGLVAMAAIHSSDGARVSGTQAAAAPEVIEVELGDLYIEPAKLSAPAGVALTFEVSNAGNTEHNFAIEDRARTDMIAPGKTATLKVPALDAGEYTFICEVSGHAGAGMKGVLTVSGDAAASDATTEAHSGHGMSGMSPEEMVKVDTEVTWSPYELDTR